jgi:hypothetical protein
MKLTLEFTDLQHSYYNELIKSGVCPEKAKQAAISMSNEELKMIAEIWIQWAVVLGKG